MLNIRMLLALIECTHEQLTSSVMHTLAIVDSALFVYNVCQLINCHVINTFVYKLFDMIFFSVASLVIKYIQSVFPCIKLKWHVRVFIAYEMAYGAEREFHVHDMSISETCYR
jgi:hypothetical protein